MSCLLSDLGSVPLEGGDVDEPAMMDRLLCVVKRVQWATHVLTNKFLYFIFGKKNIWG